MGKLETQRCMDSAGGWSTVLPGTAHVPGNVATKRHDAASSDFGKLWTVILQV